MPPMTSLTIHCIILSADSASGLGPSHCHAFCYAQSTASGEDDGLASGHLWFSGVCGPIWSTVEAIKDLRKAQAMVKCSQVKKGFECRLKGARQGGEQGMEIAHKHQRPRKAFRCQNLSSGLLIADSRAGGEVVFYEVISVSREVP